MFIAIVIFAAIVGLGVMYFLGQNHVDLNNITTGLVPKTNGIYIPDVQHAILLIVLIALALLIAYVLYNRLHNQAHVIAAYNKRSKELYDQYLAVQKARLDRIARMYYTFK